MIDVLFEQRVIQNTGLAAEVIWQSVHEAYETNGRTEGVSLPLAFLVLPLTFHQRSANALASKTQPGALYKALAEDREITVGLQMRMQAMSERTFQALWLSSLGQRITFKIVSFIRIECLVGWTVARDSFQRKRGRRV